MSLPKRLNWFDFLCTCRRQELISPLLHLFKFLRASFGVSGDVAGDRGSWAKSGTRWLLPIVRPVNFCWLSKGLGKTEAVVCAWSMVEG